MNKKFLTLLLPLFVLNVYSQKTENTDKILKNGWYEIDHSKSGVLKTDSKSGEKYYLKPEPLVTPENFKSFEEFENNYGDKGIAVYFDAEGTEIWRIATRNSIGNKLIFILNNKVFCAQSVRSEITNGASAFWVVQQTDDEWELLRKLLN